MKIMFHINGNIFIYCTIPVACIYLLLDIPSIGNAHQILQELSSRNAKHTVPYSESDIMVTSSRMLDEFSNVG